MNLIFTFTFRHPKIPNFSSPVHTTSAATKHPSIIRNQNVGHGQRINSISSSSSSRSSARNTSSISTNRQSILNKDVKHQRHRHRRGRINIPTTTSSCSSRTSSTSTPRSKNNSKSSKEGNYCDISILPQGDLRNLDYKVQY